MASKRMINRAYWVAVKATADHRPHDISAASAQAVYRLCLKGRPDSRMERYVAGFEGRYGPRRTHQDLQNRDLWEARQIIDTIRREETA